MADDPGNPEEGHADGDDHKFDRFERLTRSLLKVPKSEIDEQRKRLSVKPTPGAPPRVT